MVDVGPDFALGPKSVEYFLAGAGSMLAGAEPGQLLVPMDLNWLEAALEVVLGLLASKVNELGDDFVMEAKY